MAAAAAPMAIGAAAGAMFNRDNPLKGAMMGGLGGAALGPAMGALGGTASGVATGAPAALASGNVSIPFSGAAGQVAATNAALLPSVSAGESAMGVGTKGLLSGFSDPMVKAGMKLAMPQQQQQPLLSPPPMQPNPARQGSMASLGMGQPMIRGGRY